MDGYLGGGAEEPGNFTELVRGTRKSYVRVEGRKDGPAAECRRTDRRAREGGCNLAILPRTKVSSVPSANALFPQRKTISDQNEGCHCDEPEILRVASLEISDHNFLISL